MNTREASKLEILEKIGLTLSILTLCFIGIKSLAVSTTSVFSFDGAMNAQVARNLNRGLGYASSYPSQILFDGKIQTGPTVLLLVAMFFRVFGESFFSGLLVNALYLFLTAVTLFYLLRRCLGLAYIYTFLVLLAFTLTYELFSYGFGLYGEIPALSFLFLSIIFISKFFRSRSPYYILLSGLALGFSVLTKIVMLISLPSILLVFLANSLGEAKSVGHFRKVVCWFQMLSKPLLFFITGFLAPVVSFEIYKLKLMGVSEYLLRWKAQIMEILGQAGIISSYNDTPGTYNKLLGHLKLLNNYTGISPFISILLLTFISIGLIGLLYVYRNNHAAIKIPIFTINTTAVIVLITLSYFTWWLLITPTQKAWYRRILNGTIFLEISVVIMAAFVTKVLSGTELRFRNHLIALTYLPFLTMITCFLLHGSYNNLLISFNNTPEKSATYKMASIINSLPKDSNFYGIGWWQAPVVSFAADKNFLDLFRSPEMLIPGEKENSFLVADRYTFGYAREELDNTLNQFVYNIKYQDDYGALFELKERKLFNYMPFTLGERTQLLPSEIDFTQYDFSNPMRNVFLQERNPGGKWAQNISAYLLGYRNQNFLSIRFIIPDLSKYAKNSLNLIIFINREKVYQQSFDVSGSYEIIVPLSQRRSLSLGSTLEVTIVCDNTIAASGDTRQLSLFLTKISLRD